MPARICCQALLIILADVSAWAVSRSSRISGKKRSPIPTGKPASSSCTSVGDMRPSRLAPDSANKLSGLEALRFLTAFAILVWQSKFSHGLRR